MAALAVVPTSGGTPPEASPVLRWLAAGMPIALLVDLFCADRLDSAEVLRREGSRGAPSPRPAA